VDPIDRILLAEIDGPITPISAAYALRVLDRAEARGNTLFILRLDTPGGLEDSMRQLVKKLLRSSAPTAVWVGPAGARAASAGAIITVAAQIAAMAPGSNIGAAHPVAIGGGGEPDETMRAKIENDFTAHVRAIAAQRGRNADWIERAVLESVSATATEALELGVIDHLAADLPTLIAAIDGRVLTVRGDREVRLELAEAPIEKQEMTRQERFLFILSNPTVAYLLGILGFYGILFELWNPGTLLPGILGGISILLAIIGFQIIPISWVGVGLILLGLLFFILEIKVPSYGSLTVAGLVSLVLGSVVLIDTPGLSLPLWSLIVPVAACSALFFLVVIGIGLRAQRRPVTTGAEGLIGARGEVRALLDGRPWGYRVFVNGEFWHANLAPGAALAAPLPIGSAVRVLAVESGGLRIEPLNLPPPDPDHSGTFPISPSPTA
jgi:membrane-bound serine protease (ClpP class)